MMLLRQTAVSVRPLARSVPAPRVPTRLRNNTNTNTPIGMILMTRKTHAEAQATIHDQCTAAYSFQSDLS
jgi:hypothetical protein